MGKFTDILLGLTIAGGAIAIVDAIGKKLRDPNFWENCRVHGELKRIADIPPEEWSYEERSFFYKHTGHYFCENSHDNPKRCKNCDACFECDELLEYSHELCEECYKNEMCGDCHRYPKVRDGLCSDCWDDAHDDGD